MTHLTRIRKIGPLAGAVGFALVSVALSTSPSGQAQRPDATPEQATFFETKVRPVLIANCLDCHGKNMQMSGLRLDSIAGFLKGGDQGPAIVPGDASKSLLIKAINHAGALKMPKGKKLKANEIDDIAAWVDMGAPWPKATGNEKPSVAKKVLWSVQPITNPTPPVVKNKLWVRNPIDAFVLAKLEARKLAPQPEADKRTLLRRVSYDLTGLPPTAAQVDAFLADKRADAYERAVDGLLVSPRRGERWARLWLDVARYADTKGYVFEEDRNYANAYTYRQWVIDAFNKDLPYDQFIIQQLAADRLPEVQNGDDKRPLAALGFLSVGRRFLNSVPDIMDDRIDVTMRGFQGLTVACARCHDHKFDPVPTQDYYSLYAIFNSSEEATLPISERAIRDPWERYSNELNGAVNDRNGLVMAQTGRLRQMGDAAPAEIKQTLQGIRPETMPDGENLKKLRKAFEQTANQRLDELDGRISKLRANAPQTPEFAMAMRDRSNPGDGVVFKRGNPGNPGDPAPRRFLMALTAAGAERAHWNTSSGRLELAQAIASKENPLTARVFVNRVWLHLFGAGIVRTPSDFGFQGEKPTHPELLDYLSTWFMKNGWSVRKLQKLIVTSAAYRQASSAPVATFTADPENRLISRMNRRRLDLEETRDSILNAANRLDMSTVGGRSVDIWSKPFSTKRSVYGFIDRQNLPGIFKTFDFASPDSTNAQRFRTTVPQQALFFMNSPFVMEQARALSVRDDITKATDDGQRIRRIYRSLFGRLPKPSELSVGLGYLKPGAESLISTPGAVWQYGYATFDPKAERVALFTPFAVFADGFYRGGQAMPDPKLGYLLLNNVGGHPGRDLSQVVVRRWVSPGKLTLRITGALNHPEERGDGVRGRVVSSRVGVIGEWKAHKSVAATVIEPVYVEKGDTLDFVVDAITNEGFDGFAWAPTIEAMDRSKKWDAMTDFAPPGDAPVSRLTLYIQALMMTNEFVFLD